MGVTGRARGCLSFPPVGIRFWWRQTHGDESFLPKRRQDKDLGTFVSATPRTPLGQRNETPGLTQPSQTARLPKALGPARPQSPTGYAHFQSVRRTRTDWKSVLQSHFLSGLPVVVPGPGPMSPGFGFTTLPGRTWYSPSMTTRSPGFSPSSTI